MGVIRGWGSTFDCDLCKGPVDPSEDVHVSGEVDGQSVDAHFHPQCFENSKYAEGDDSAAD